MKSTAQIRQEFLDYFHQHGHQVVPSSSLVPGNDPTLLFTNAGMVQFKDVFLGAEQRDYQRAVTSQRCVRAGGKHNDLDQVGYTARHHTFFEMLGNFSFGDYFKQEAIRLSWALLTEVFGLAPERLWVTVYHTDDEAWELWAKDIGVPEERIIRIGDKPGGKAYESDNFWAMGDTGPCGPCSEIFYDHGPEVDGGPPGSPDEDGDRYIEIWNLVFMQFDRAADGSMRELPRPCVDTGMGLERVTAVLQGVHSNYQIDLFQALIAAAARLTACDDLDNPSLKVIADHIRACAFLISDGVLPSNEGRGYVLRRIIRRAIRHGYKLGRQEPFFSDMVPALVQQMGEAYSELRKRQDSIMQVLLEEEQRFARTLDAGMGILGRLVAKARQNNGVIGGQEAFELYDTYGFPLDLTEDVARESELTVDREGFERAMEEQRQRARSAGQFRQQAQLPAEAIQSLPATRFTGYEQLSTADARVAGILQGDRMADSLAAGDEAILILDSTPFYAESGGQVGDTGVIEGSGFRFRVDDTQKLAGVFHGHVGQLESGNLNQGDAAEARVDAGRRQAIVLHHSATHLLHAALRKVLGEHVEQKGSLVAPDHLRFDFSHGHAVTPDELQRIEQLVNAEIRANADAEIRHMSFDDAIESGAMALFGEKYDDQVRVLRLGDFSVELCGGTHVHRAGDIGFFKIRSEGGIAAGVRRIEALVGDAAEAWVGELDARQQRLAALLKSGPAELEQKLGQLLERSRELEKSLQKMKQEMAQDAGRNLLDSAVQVGNAQLVVAELADMDSKGLREAVDDLKSRIPEVVVVLAASEGDTVRLIAGVGKPLTDRIRAGDLVNHVASQVGGKGGGRPDLAQAGGSDVAALPAALDSVQAWVEERLQ